MQSDIRIVYLAHSIRSDWNNGNAHFLRGLLRALTQVRQSVIVFEPERGWSIDNLYSELGGEESLRDFHDLYPEIDLRTYPAETQNEQWVDLLNGVDIVILHEWNPPALAQQMLELRERLGFRLLFHDTHHRASSSPEQIALFGLTRFDGILAFGESLSEIYRRRLKIDNVWTLHEAADTTIFHPIHATKAIDVVWIGNWGDGERSAEIQEFLLGPASALVDNRFTIYGVRYPEEARDALREAGVPYLGYLANLSSPEVYAKARLTVHIPRQQYNGAMTGIPTIRVFEALACGIPLLSAPWQDSECLFRPGDLCFVQSGAGMEAALKYLLKNPNAAEDQAQRGLERVLARHTCAHRAQELIDICNEVLA